MATIGQLVVQIVADLTQFSTGLSGAAGRLEAFVGKAEQAGRAFQTVGLTLTAAGAAVTAPLALAVKSAADFEAAMRNANTVLEASEEGFREVGREVVELSKTVPKTATDLAQGLFFVAGSGFRGAEAMKVLRESAIAATAGLTNTQTAAQVIVGSLNAFGLSADRATEVSDILFQTVASGIITFEELAQEFGPVSASAALLGVSLTETGIALAAVTRAGLNAAEATTAVARLFDQLINPGEAMKAVFTELGVTSGQAAIAQFGLAGVLAKVVDVAGRSSEATFQLAGNIRSLRALANLTKNDMALFNAVQGEFADVSGATARAFEQQAKSFQFAFAILRNNIGALAIQIGSVLLPPLTTIVTALTRAVAAVVRFAEAHPIATRAIVFLTAGLGILATLVGTSFVAFGTFLVVLGKLPGILQGASLGIQLLAKALPILAVGIRAVVTALLANPIGLIIAGIGTALLILAPLVIKHWDTITAAFKTAIAFITTLVTEFAKGYLKIWEGIFTFDFSKIREGADQIAGAFNKALTTARETFGREMPAGEEAVKRVAAATADVEHGMGRVKKAADDVVLSVEQIKLKYDEAAAAADLFGKQAELAAARQAEASLRAPGLTEADITAIAERQAKAEQRASAETLRRKIAARQAEIDQLKKTGALGAKDLREAELDLAGLKTDLARLGIEDARRTAEAIVSTEKAAAQQRLETERILREAQLELSRTTAEAQKTILSAQAEAEEQARQQRLDQIRLEEELRIGMLRRVASLEQTLGQGVIDARIALAQIATTREEAALRTANIRRQALVQQGLLSEQDARREADEQSLALLTAKAKREFQIEQERLTQVERRQQVEAGLLVAEAQSKIRVLQAEQQARFQQLASNQAIREADLQAAIATARAETQAKIAEIQAQTQARLIETEAELRARRAAGLITPQEEAARLSALAGIRQATATQQAALLEGLAARELAVNRQLQISRTATEQAKQAITQETAAREEDIQSQLQAELLRLQTAGVNERAQIAQRVAALAAQLQTDLAERQAAIETGQTELFPQQLQALQALLLQIQSFSTQQVGIVQTGLNAIEVAYQTLSAAIVAALQPAIEAVKQLTSPERIQQILNLLRQFPAVPQAPAAPLVPRGQIAPGPAGALGGVGGATQTVTVPLVVEGRTIGQVALDFLNGQLVGWTQATPTT